MTLFLFDSFLNSIIPQNKEQSNAVNILQADDVYVQMPKTQNIKENQSHVNALSGIAFTLSVLVTPKLNCY